MLRIIVAFSTTLAVAVIIVAILITNSNPDVRNLGTELGKLVGQVTLVSVIGGVLLQEYNRRRERAGALTEFRKGLLKTFVRSYADAKSCRRLLRAKCRARKPADDSPPIVELLRLTYEERMGALNDTQLELEIIIHDLHAFPGAFAKRNELRKLVVKMENYLDWMKSAYRITATFCPAISVPAGFTEEGLPVGIQIVGRYRDDLALLQLAHAFEQTTLFGKRRPPIA